MINNSIKRIFSLVEAPSKNKYRILTFPTHERYQTQLCKTGHDFFEFNMSKQKKWNLDQCPFPANYYSLPENETYSCLNYDFILSQSKFWQFQVASQIGQNLNIPIISLEHTVPLIGVQQENQINHMRSMIGNINIFITEYSRDNWKLPVDSHIIHHGIDTDYFKPDESIEKNIAILTVANDFINRDYCLNYSGWKRITSGLSTRLIGDTPGLSVSAPIEILVREYNRCGIYLNTSTLSPIPTSLLEAMSCGCAVVSTQTCEIPNIIQNGHNGYISNDEKELRKYLEILLNDEEERARIGINARQTILDKFSEQKFITEWNTIFNTAYEVFNR